MNFHLIFVFGSYDSGTDQTSWIPQHVVDSGDLKQRDERRDGCDENS